MLTLRFEATLDGLEKSSAARPGNPPLYIHVSGCGILSDNARGELKEPVKMWSDIGLDLEECACCSFLMGSHRQFSPFTPTQLRSNQHTFGV